MHNYPNSFNINNLHDPTILHLPLLSITIMPAAAPFRNPLLIRAYFDYDPATGKLTHKPDSKIARLVGAPVIRRANNFQYYYEGYARTDHRIIWAMHHPENANPKFIVFLDGDKTNTRIENLMGTDTNPRWIGHTKQPKVSMRLLPNGKFVYAEFYDAELAKYQESLRAEQAQRQAHVANTLKARLGAKGGIDVGDWD